jgi:hypothetical protein
MVRAGLQYWRGAFKKRSQQFHRPATFENVTMSDTIILFSYLLYGDRNAGNCAGSPDADAVDLSVAQIHSANACEGFLSVSRIIGIDSEVETRKQRQFLAGAQNPAHRQRQCRIWPPMPGSRGPGKMAS